MNSKKLTQKDENKLTKNLNRCDVIMNYYRLLGYNSEKINEIQRKLLCDKK